MDANEHFEAVAELFYKATGHLAPGKSEPPEFSGDDRERNTLWGIFLAGRASARTVPPFPAPPPAAGGE